MRHVCEEIYENFNLSLYTKNVVQKSPNEQLSIKMWEKSQTMKIIC